MSSDHAYPKVVITRSNHRTGIGQGVADPDWIVIADDLLREVIQCVPDVASGRLFDGVNLYLVPAKPEVSDNPCSKGVMLVALVGIGQAGSGEVTPTTTGIIPLIKPGSEGVIVNRGRKILRVRNRHRKYHKCRGDEHRVEGQSQGVQLFI